MSKQKEMYENKDMETFLKLEDMVEDLELQTQKALSLMVLNVEPKDAFNDAMIVMDKMKNLHESITDESVKFVATEKINLAIDVFKTKLLQVNAEHLI